MYPTIKPYQCHELAVTGSHVLYLEETGNPKGLPILVIHSASTGGESNLRRYFDPDVFRIIIFDQRGCGRSSPRIKTEHNTTADLIKDIEAIRTHLKLDEMILWGGGWGALLALLYAQAHPTHVQGMLLYSIFLGRQEDINWLYQQGANLFCPDYWQEFSAFAPENQRHNLLGYYLEQLLSNNELARMNAAKHWATWQARCSTFQPHQVILDTYSEPHFALALATLEAHYIANHFFITENQALTNCHKIRHIPTWLVHGRYDVISPLANAWTLHDALPNSTLSIVRDAGHSEREAGIIEALIAASKEISRHDARA